MFSLHANNKQEYLFIYIYVKIEKHKYKIIIDDINKKTFHYITSKNNERTLNMIFRRRKIPKINEMNQFNCKYKKKI